MKASKNDKRYEEIAVIGKGAFGYVVKAYDRKEDRIVAIKRIQLKKHEADFNSINEIVTLKKIAESNHKYKDRIVLLLETIRKNNQLSIVFEYGNFDLYTLISKYKPLSINLCVHILSQIFEALLVLDNLHIVHRDIKPENILVFRDFSIKLTDFGIAKFLDDTPDQSIAGTLCYMSPELLLNSKKFQISSDMWAVGCIFFELLTGNRLFPSRAHNPIDQLIVISKIVGPINSNTFPGVTNLPNYAKYREFHFDHTNNFQAFLRKQFNEDIVELLSRMLVIDPDKRIKPAEALNFPLIQNRSPLDTNIQLDFPESHHNDGSPKAKSIMPLFHHKIERIHPVSLLLQK